MNKLINKLWLKKLLNTAFVISCFCYLLSCLTPFVHPKYFFGFSFLAIGFTLLFITMFLWFLLYLFISKRKALLSILIILLGYKNIGSNIGFCIEQNNNSQTIQDKTLKLLSWNVRDFADDIYIGKQKKGRENYFAFIKEINADVLCLQDVDNTIWQHNLPSFNYIKDSLHYPYAYFSIDIDTFFAIYNGREQYGTCIFSRYPIINSNHINYAGNHFTESLGFADVLYNNKIIRFYNTHLKSMYLKIPKEQKLSDFKYIVDDTNLVMHSNMFTKIKRYDTSHIAQAQLIKKVLDTTSLPFVFCGDLNSTPSSFVYHTISKGLQDAYLENNLGWGKTYFSKIPGMRIDVVLTSNKIVATKYNSPQLRLSDHMPIITHLKIIK